METLRIGTGAVSAEIWTLGAALNALWVPDRDGGVTSVVLGHADEGERLAGNAFLGEIVGPFGNRLKDARFTIDGVTHQTERSFLGKHSLHSGSDGFHRQEWLVAEADADHVRLTLTWSDTTGDHPGPIHAAVTYRAEGSTFSYVIEVTTEASTVVNVVAHPYVNLVGEGTILDQVLTIAAEEFLPVDDEMIPTAHAPAEVEGRFDLRAGKTMGEIIAEGGVDHCFVLDGAGLRHVASVADPHSGRRLDIETDEPGLQIYDGRGLEEVGYQEYGGMAIETQGFPDAPNRPDFPSALLRPGQTRTSTTIWSFSTT